mgnify:CR=1 FL=1
MRKEIKNLYGSNVGKSYDEDLKRSRSRRSDPEGRRLQRYGESEVKGYQRRAASSKNTKVDKEAMRKIEKSVNVKYKSSKGSKLPQLAKQVAKKIKNTRAAGGLAGMALGFSAPYITKAINKGVDKGFKYLSKRNSGTKRKKL